METNRPDYTETLTRHGIRPTAVRLLIYKTALRFHDTFSMSELEDALESVDKSTVFRTLSLFAARHLLHEIEDGSGSTKYCICRNDRPCGIDELHCHFHCALPQNLLSGLHAYPRRTLSRRLRGTADRLPAQRFVPRLPRETACMTPSVGSRPLCNRVARISRYICLRKPTSSPRPFRTDGLDKKERYSEKSMTAGKFFVPLLR